MEQHKDEEEVFDVFCNIIGVKQVDLRKVQLQFSYKVHKYPAGMRYCGKTLKFKFSISSDKMLYLFQNVRLFYYFGKNRNIPFASIYIYDIFDENIQDDLSDLVKRTRLFFKYLKQFEILVGFKSDQTDPEKQEVPTEQGQKLGKKLDLKFIQSESEHSYQRIFEELAKMIVPPSFVQDFTTSQLRTSNILKQIQLAQRERSTILEEISDPETVPEELQKEELASRQMPPSRQLDSSVLLSQVVSLSPSTLLQAQKIERIIESIKVKEKEARYYKDLVELVSPLLSEKPGQFLKPNLSASQKATFEQFRKGVKNLFPNEEGR